MAVKEDLSVLPALVQAVRAGDKRALNQLLQRLWPWLSKKVGVYWSRLTPPIGVSSLTQETALRLSRSIHRMRDTNTPAIKALVNRIIKNTAVSAHRAATRKKRDAGHQPIDDLLPKDFERADERIERTERDRRVAIAMGRLPARQRQAIQLLSSGASTAEIAKALGCRLGATQMLVKRAKTKLAKFLNKEDVALLDDRR